MTSGATSPPPAVNTIGGRRLPAKLLICLALSQFAIQLFAFAYLYAYLMKLDSRMGSYEAEVCNDSPNFRGDSPFSRRKRSGVVPATEDNSVPDMFRIGDAKEQLGDSKKSAAASLEDPTNGGDTAGWIWLTADTRVPWDAMDALCRKSTEYCPPGSPGVPGPRGAAGDRGLPGIPGPVGPEGPPGLPGYPGERGSKGDPGRVGFDGRDGIPGEPGLDGIPGRSGLDGIPGNHGRPGMNGIPGMPGKNGTDGKRGQKGAPGPIGPVGPPGPTGRAGNPGSSGRDGKPGIPGIVAWKLKRNETKASELLIPPSILGDGNPTGVITVIEGTNVRLRCAVHGNPWPTVSWSKTSGYAIPVGSWHASSISGPILNITVVNREHMGEYICIADNGVPPQASYKINLEVHFAPLIRIGQQRIRGQHQGSAILECDVEAFPEPVTWWERSDGRPIQSSLEYHMDIYDRRDIYKFKMRLNVTRISSSDIGVYHCNAKNVIDMTRGTLLIDDGRKKGNLPNPGSQLGVVIFGPKAPPKIDLEELCPPQRSCDDCPHIKCAFSDFGGRFDVKPLISDAEYVGAPPRIAEGVLEAIGKPIFRGSVEDPHGCWMYDSLPKSEAIAEKRWVTRRANASHIFEYENLSDMRNGHPRDIRLPYPFKGNAHVVYNGSFFYNPENRSSVVRLDLKSPFSDRHYYYDELHLPGLDTENKHLLYSSDHNSTYVDFDVDENGLWLIYGLPSNNTVVMKIDTYSMQIQQALNMSIDNHKFGEMFIASGVLYGVHNITDNEMKIRLALDLYKSTSLNVDLSFNNPYQRTMMIRYSHRTKELYTWDRGNLLAYPVRYRSIGYNATQTLDAT